MKLLDLEEKNQDNAFLRDIHLETDCITKTGSQYAGKQKSVLTPFIFILIKMLMMSEEEDL